MNYSGGGNGGTDDTNSYLLVNPQYSALGSYAKNPGIFKCPADRALSLGLSGSPRVRSYSMNQAVGSTVNGTVKDGTHTVGHWLPSVPAGGIWLVYLKDSDITPALSSSDIWVFIDEHPDSINDAAFGVKMPINPIDTHWLDKPAKFHNNNCGFSFMDGHSEIHKWTNPSAIPNPDYNSSIGNTDLSVPNNLDVKWVARHTSALSSGGINPF